MARARGDVVGKQRTLGKIGVVDDLGVRVVRLFRPIDERGHRARGPVTVIDLERETLGADGSLHALQGFRRLPHQYAFRRLVAGHLRAREIVGASIAHVLQNRRIDVAQIDEVLRHLAGANNGGQAKRAGKDEWGEADALRQARHVSSAGLVARLPNSP